MIIGGTQLKLVFLGFNPRHWGFCGSKGFRKYVFGRGYKSKDFKVSCYTFGALYVQVNKK